MKHILICFISLVLCSHSLAQTVYTWTDNKGVLHLSDTPPESASNLDSFDIVEDNPTVIAPTDDQSLTNNSSHENQQSRQTTSKTVPVPLTIQFESPMPEQTIRDNQGRIQISLQTNRKLSIDETLQLVLNNEAYGAPQTKKKWTLINVDRGTHTFMIKALRSGKLIASTDTISVHLHRAKVN